MQCYRCAGYLTAAAGPAQKVRCPHCAWEARASEFRLVGADELGSVAAGAGYPASASVELGDGAWVRKGKYLEFACPHCERPMRLLPEDAGGLADCPHCMLEIISPDPAGGTPARLSDASLRLLGCDAGRLKKRPSVHSARLYRPAVTEAEPEPTPSPFIADEPAQLASPFSVEGEEPSEFLAEGRPRPVRVLDLAQIGAAFKARDDLDPPRAIAWEEESRADDHERGSPPDGGRSRAFTFVAAALLTLVGSMFVILEIHRHRQPSGAARPVDRLDEAAGGTQEKPLERAFAFAASTVGALNWREVLPSVRSRPRVEPIMEAYYQSIAYEPVSLASLLGSSEVNSGGINYVQLRVEDDDGRERLVVLEKMENGGYLFDWELWVDIAGAEWQRFLEHRPKSRVSLRVTVSRSPVLGTFAADAGLEVGDARCLRIWLNDPAESLYAVFPKSDEGAMQAWEGTSWDLGHRVVAELSFPPRAGLPERVELHRVLQPRWLVR